MVVDVGGGTTEVAVVALGGLGGGTAGGDVFLTVERDRAVAALAGGNGDARLINEFRCHIEKPPSGVSFSNFKKTPRGDPPGRGGDGGNGGDIILQVDDNMSTLMDFRYKRKYTAENGMDGQGSRKFGKSGK